MNKNDFEICKHQWISVNDKLPEKDGSYLTCVNGLKNDEYYYLIRKYFSKKKIFSSESTHKYITHWMLLPNPPTDENKCDIKSIEGLF